MPLDQFHRTVATIALRAAVGYGFALGGGNALIAHGIIDRPTQDVDLFTNRESGVAVAGDAVETALREAGFGVERQDWAAGLTDLFGEGTDELEQGLAEWLITAPGGEQMALQLAYFARGHTPVTMEVGPVLDIEDALGGKVNALASRAYERDYVDVAAALDRYTPGQLISFGQRLDPGLAARDFAEAGSRLDLMPDEAFTHLGLTAHDVATLRERFAGWPRDH
jgi:nucleotidyltransferase AbiEii toxin of type IV toxin-antitoxin system